MIVIDANILLYAYQPRATQHDVCRKWLEQVFNDPAQIGLPWQTIQAFIRISTHPRVFAAPLSINEATDIVAEWLRLPQVVQIGPSDRYWAIFSDLLRDAQVRGPMVTDTALAAIAIEHGATLFSTDQDFSRFKGLKWQDPTPAESSK